MSIKAGPRCLKCLDGEFSGFRGKRDLKLDALYSLKKAKSKLIKS